METSSCNQFSEKRLILRMPYQITSADTDMGARLRLGALVNLLIQAAMNSADILGCGFDEVRRQHLFWIFSRLTVEIYQPLMWRQLIEVETWPKNVEKFIYIRDFFVYDQDKQIVARATSNWMAIDLETKRPKMVEGSYTPVFSQLKDRHALNNPPEKLFPVRDGEIFEVKSVFFDIDLNKHVTSSRYIDWLMDTFPIAFHSNNYPKKVSINFLSETRPGETIRLVRDTVAEKSFVFEGFNKTSETFAFRAAVEFI